MKMGSAQWKFQYQMRRKPWLLLVPAALAMLLIACAALWLGGGTEAVTRTVGQSVIDGWVYGGIDSGGNLIFQQGDRVVLLPTSSEEIKLNGKTVALLGSTPDTIEVGLETAEQTTDTASFPWWLFWLLTGVGIGLLVGRMTGKPAKVRPPKRSLRRWQGRMMR